MNISNQYFHGISRRWEIEAFGKGWEIYTDVDPTRILGAFRMVFSNTLPTMTYGRSFLYEYWALLITTGANGKEIILKKTGF